MIQFASNNPPFLYGIIDAMTNGNMNDETNQKTASPEDTLPIPVKDESASVPDIPETPARNASADLGATRAVSPKRAMKKPTQELPPLPRFAAAAKTSEPEPLPEEMTPLPEPGEEPPQYDEQPPVMVEPPKKPKRFKWVLLGILVMLIFAAIGSAIGYAFAIRARQAAELNQTLVAVTTQFELGLVDQQQGRLETARQRFEYVLKYYPSFPGISDKLVEIGLEIAQNQPAVTTPMPEGTQPPEVTPVATKDTRSLSVLLNQAEAQLEAQDWEGLYNTVFQLRNIDPEYEPVKVDGMFYMALRNHGIAQILKGNLEPGLYDFALAKEIAPLDRDAAGYQTWASMYLEAGSYWVINWFTAVNKFAELHPMVPQLIDSSGQSVTKRYAYALAGYGESLQQLFQYCDAVPYFEQAVGIYNDEVLPQRLAQAQEFCAEPPPTPTPTVDPKAPTPTENGDN